MPFGSIGISIPLNYPSVTRDGKRIDTRTETKAAAQENMRECGKKNEKGTERDEYTTDNQGREKSPSSCITYLPVS